MLGEGRGACWERGREPGWERIRGHAGRGLGEVLGEGRGACWGEGREHAEGQGAWERAGEPTGRGSEGMLG